MREVQKVCQFLSTFRLDSSLASSTCLLMDLGLVLVAVFDFIALLLSFFSLCTVCDEHLVPAVEVFIVQFQVPEEVAAVTLVAFGSAAPELFLNSVSAVVHTSDLSLAAILGSGIIAFGLIPPLCILNSNQPRVKLHLYPIIRESGFYLLGLFVFLGSIRDGRIASSESLLIIAVYACYTSTVAVMYYRNRDYEAAERAAEEQASANTDNIDVPVPSSPIHRGGSAGTTVGNNGATSPRAATGVKALQSPTADQACAFFPTLSRSNSDLSRTRRGNNTQSTTLSSQQVQLSPIGSTNSLNSGRSTSPRDQRGALDETIDTITETSTHSVQSIGVDNEYASLLSDDIESHNGTLSSGGNGNTDGAASDANSTGLGLLLKLFHCFYSPVQHLARGLLPSLHPQIPHFIYGNNSHSSNNGSSNSSGGSRNPAMGNYKVPLRRAIFVLLSSILAIGVLAVSIVIFCESVIAKLGFSSTAMGATLVALGAEIPDTVSAVALARNGYVNAAVAGAIGSQVINVSLGVGVPALLVGFFGDGYLHVTGAQADSLTLLTCLLIIVILSYTTVTVPIGKMIINGAWSNNTIVSKPGAVFQIFIWLLTYVTFLHLNKAEGVAPVG